METKMILRTKKIHWMYGCNQALMTVSVGNEGPIIAILPYCDDYVLYPWRNHNELKKQHYCDMNFKFQS
jgi:hypothetical protein